MLLKVVAVFALLIAYAISCENLNHSVKNSLTYLRASVDLNVQEACDDASKKAVLEFILKTLNVLKLKVKKPCVFTFQPLPFNTNCTNLVYKSVPEFITYLNQILGNLDTMCTSQCPIESSLFDNMVTEYIAQVKQMLANIP
ncbi:hypothetical protein L596_008908 [Steinernema carpocapsae]|uniref:Uncharacterized protein n=1 Tax=Steinernema carpocapsae TaxID=34508 RepID=A0A4U5PDU3_STECR|nr:hypothetical protein L596_008908 [Steinernema carpocapsae]